MIWFSRNPSRLSRDDRWLSAITGGCSLASAAIVLLIFGFVIQESWPALHSPGLTRLASDRSWHPLSNQFRMTPMVLATVLTAGSALVLAGPLGIATAVWICFYAPRAAAVVCRRLVEVLAGIPSVVYGLWGLSVLAPLISRLGGSGQSVLTAAVVLGLMILPTIVLTSLVALRSTPLELLQGGAALGLNRRAIVWRIALPAARRGIGGGLLLALGRALGETMAVMMLAGNVVQFPTTPLAPVRTLTANIALEMGYASPAHRSVLFVAGLVLLAVVAAVVWLAGSLERSRYADH